jgi:pyruvate/2-oxoacid:ferredoxin oxidoreductase alpha subunit
VVGVFDQNLAPGAGGILYPEVAGALYNLRGRPGAILPIVGALGGKQTTAKEMAAVFEEMIAIDKGKTPAPLFLMRGDEMTRVKKMIAVAEGRS